MITATVEDMTINYLPAAASPDDLAAFRTWVNGETTIGFDVEAGGSNPLDHWAPGWHSRLVGFGSLTEAWVLHADLADAIRYGLSRPVPYVAFNAGYDRTSVKRAYGMAPRSCLDASLGALMVFPPASPLDEDDDDEPADADDRHRLKPLSARTGSDALIHADAALHKLFAELEPRPKGSDKTNAVKEWEGRGYSTAPVDDERYWIYNGLDSIFGLRVLRWMFTQWPGKSRDFRALLVNESRLDTALSGIPWRGLRIDRPALRAVYDQAKEAEAALAPAFAQYDVTNPASAPQRDAALRALDVVDPVLSDAGLVSTDKQAGMPRLFDPDQPDKVREFAGLLREWRDHDALIKKTKEIDRLASASTDGRLHPGVNGLRARTSRMSIVRPAIQNLPKNDQRIRAAFVFEDGYVGVGADFGQVEFRVAAALSRDPELYAVIVGEEKIHNANARRIFGDEFTEAQYGQAKNGGFSVMYGAGPRRIAITFGDGTTLRQASEFLDQFRASYPGLANWIKKVQRHDEIVSLSGRRTAIDPNKRYANPNYHIQGVARDLLADALLWLLDHGWGDYLWLVIHDEIILQVPVAMAADAQAALEQAMRSVLRGIPITADAEILGDRWGKLPEPQLERTAA